MFDEPRLKVLKIHVVDDLNTILVENQKQTANVRSLLFRILSEEKLIRRKLRRIGSTHLMIASKGE